MPNKVVSSALTAVLVLAAGSGVNAGAASVPAYRAIPGALPEPLPTAGLVNREELEAFIDGIMATQLSAQHVAGATIAVVKDGELSLPRVTGSKTSRRRYRLIPSRRCFESAPHRSSSPGRPSCS